MPDEIILTNDLLARRSDDLIFDRGEHERLANGIRSALREIRERVPHLSMVRPVPEFDVQSVGVALNADSMDIVVEAMDGEEYGGAIKTGLSELDELNSRLGLRGIWWSRYEPDGDGSLSLCLSDLVNTSVAAEQYEGLQGVEYAEVGGPYSIGPFTDVAVDEGSGTLYIVARQKGSDCGLVCLDFDYYYFRMRGSVLEELNAGEALQIDRFERLGDFVG